MQFAEQNETKPSIKMNNVCDAVDGFLGVQKQKQKSLRNK